MPLNQYRMARRRAAVLIREPFIRLESPQIDRVARLHRLHHTVAPTAIEIPYITPEFCPRWKAEQSEEQSTYVNLAFINLT